MKNKRNVDSPEGIQFESSKEDDHLLKALMDMIPDDPQLKEEDQEEDLEKSIRRKNTKQSRIANASQTPDATLDLHGKTKEEAIIMVQNFVMTSHQQRFRSLLIITGKGFHSGKEGPVLKHAVQSWLKRNGSPYIQNFYHAPSEHGGTGALWINLL